MPRKAAEFPQIADFLHTKDEPCNFYYVCSMKRVAKKSEKGTITYSSKFARPNRDTVISLKLTLVSVRPKSGTTSNPARETITLAGAT